MTTATQVKALIRSHADGDDTRFYAIAMWVAAQAAKSGTASLLNPNATITHGANRPFGSANSGSSAPYFEARVLASPKAESQ